MDAGGYTAIAATALSTRAPPPRAKVSLTVRPTVRQLLALRATSGTSAAAALTAAAAAPTTDPNGDELSLWVIYLKSSSKLRLEEWWLSPLRADVDDGEGRMRARLEAASILLGEKAHRAVILTPEEWQEAMA